MVKRICVIIVVLSIFLLIVSTFSICKRKQYWCDNCQQLYNDGHSRYVLIGTVDRTLCESCYRAMLKDGQVTIPTP